MIYPKECFCAKLFYSNNFSNTMIPSASILYPPTVTHRKVWIMWISLQNPHVFAK